MRYRVAVFIHQPYCSIQSANGVIKSLGSDFDYKIFTRHELEDDFFNDVDIVCFPGGIGDADKHEMLFRINAEPIRNFVARGGYYLGICMGAYWASSDYFDIVQDVEVQQYIRRPNTTIRRYYSTTAQVNWQGTRSTQFFYDGPAFVPKLNWRVPFQTVATYPNGDAMAVIQNRIGLVGCHPEAQEFWYDKPYLLRNYYNNNHLLREFVHQLVK